MMKKLFTLMLLFGVVCSAHAQQWVQNSTNLHFYNADGPTYMEPDYSSYAVYFKDKTPDVAQMRMGNINGTSLTDINVFSRLNMAEMNAKESFGALRTQADVDAFLKSSGLDAMGAYDVAPAFMVNGSKAFFTQQVIIHVKQGIGDGELQTMLNKYGAQLERRGDNLLLKVDRIGSQLAMIQDLKRADMITWGHPNFQVEIEHHNDPLYPEQYQMNNTGGSLDGNPLANDIDIDAPEAWALQTGNSNIVVCVIDDGVEAHPDLPNIIAGFTPATGGNGTPLNTPGNEGEHGEACAGIIAAQHNNSIGVRGVAPGVQLLTVNIFAGGETIQDLADAFTWSVNNGADVISNSWGFSGNCSDNLYQAITDAINNAANNGRGGLGCSVLFSSGNDYNSCISYPSSIASVVAVGAVSPDGAISTYSNQGPRLDVVAPSNDLNASQTAFIYGVRTTDRTGGNGYASGDYTTSFGGTSAACPAAAGVAALVLSANASLTGPQVFNILTSTADDMGASGFDNTYANGRVNAFQAVLAAGSSNDTQAPTDPSGLSASNVTATTADLSWTASTDNVGVAGYNIYVNGSQFATATGTSTTLSGLSPSTSYAVYVTAYDGNSNESGASNTVNFTTSVAVLSCASTVTSYPYAEGFESGDGWNQDSGDDGNWVNFSGSTPSSGTGPTSAVQGSNYMYLEASTNGTAGQIGNNATAILTSNCFDLGSATSATFSFQNHMNGANMGTLTLQATVDDLTWATLWTQTGNQGNAWNSVNVDLAAYVGGTVKLRFVGTTGPGWESDLAIDDLSLTTSGGPGDTQAPTTPTGLAASNVTTTSFDVSWTASTDNVGVTGYNVYLNGSLDGSTAGTSYSFSGLSASTTYTVAVEAEDAAGNTSGQASTSVTTSDPGSCTNQTVNSNNFEGGFGIWNDGGSDCRRSSRDASFANSGSFCVRLRDNTSTSVMTTDALDLSQFQDLTVSFSYITNSMDNANEDFWLQLSTNGGGSFATVEEWNLGDEFVNNVRENDAVTLTGPFTANTLLRFRCDASGNNDQVYIDDVVITGCSNGTTVTITSNNLSVPESFEEEFDLEEVRVFPNPTNGLLTIVNLPQDANVRVMNIAGQVLYQGVTTRVDLSDQPKGMYMVQVMTDEAQRVIKVMKK